MYRLLPKPVTTKHTKSQNNSKYRTGSSRMQGWRPKMQDSCTHILSMPEDPGAAFFGIYDGHGCSAKISDYARTHLHHYVINRKEYRDGNIREALKKGFLELDQVMRKKQPIDERSGSCALVVLVKGDKLYCANLGDSRAIASVRNVLLELSYDHKTHRPEEQERIKKAGGQVICGKVICKRVNGRLAITRAFGDYHYKEDTSRAPEKQIVTALPDVIEENITPEWNFVVLASDGIWNVSSNDNVLSFVTTNIARGYEPEKICELLMIKCLRSQISWHSKGGTDNMTVIIIVFLHDKTYDDVVKDCKNYLDNPKRQQAELHQA